MLGKNVLFFYIVEVIGKFMSKFCKSSFIRLMVINLLIFSIKKFKLLIKFWNSAQTFQLCLELYKKYNWQQILQFEYASTFNCKYWNLKKKIIMNYLMLLGYPNFNMNCLITSSICENKIFFHNIPFTPSKKLNIGI